MGTSLFALCDLGTEIFFVMRCQPIQVVPCLTQQFVKHAPGRLDHTLICFTTGDVVFLNTASQCTSAFVEVSESLGSVSTEIAVALAAFFFGVCGR